MSHLTCSMIQIHDLDILRKSVAGFGGLKWNEGATKFTSYGSTGQTESEFGTCEHSITVDGASGGYQIGVIKRKDGQGWSLAFDPLDGGVLEAVGRDSAKLICAYEECYVRDFAEKNGFICEQTTDSEGNTLLELTSSN